MNNLFIITLLLIPGAAFGYDSVADYEETAKKLYAKHSTCAGEFWDNQFEVETERCIVENPKKTRLDCEVEADARISEIPFHQSDEACGQFRPTTYRDPSDPYKIERVASMGAMSAMMDGHVAKGIRMFHECVAVGDVDCHYRLGVLMYQGDVIKKNQSEALKLLKFAADNGHDEARAILDDLHGDRKKGE